MSDTLKNLSATADATSVENALQFYQSGNFEKARSICHNLLDTDPNNSEALLLLGKIDYQVKKTAKTPVADPPLAYHLWYYDTKIWKTTSWAGIRTLKSPSDMWNYQEIICSLKPSFIIEFGARFGGSALFFAALMKQISPRPKVFSVDIDLDSVSDLTKQEPIIELMAASSASPEVAKRITELREEYPGPVFAILDSDHSKSHVLKEMLLLRPLLKSGDYVVVEDSNINGHPVRPGWGDGPFEAVQEYFEKYPNDYEIDRGREQKFGFTFATNGFLKRVNNC
ncbi:MAG: rhamnosyl O-methyltransferase [Okeania sp. SIO2H7]|nr:rhamnosyl O-methyltransferase [Okeania sp. SIO2H7]